MAPGAAQADTDGVILPGWELPATVTVQPDGSILAEADPAALAQLEGDPALAASGCGSACESNDPGTYVWNGATCAKDGKTVKAVYEPGGGYRGAELRYSPRCRTAWARWSAAAPSGTTISVHSYNSNGTHRLAYYADNYDRYNYAAWTAMTNDAGLTASACYSYTDFICSTKY